MSDARLLSYDGVLAMESLVPQMATLFFCQVDAQREFLLPLVLGFLRGRIENHFEVVNGSL